MGKDREIQTAIQKLAGTFKSDTVLLISGVVKSVDENKATCVCIVENGVELPNVLLQSAICDGLLILPKEKSSVYILTSKYNQPIIIQYSDVDKFYLQVKDAALEVTNDGKIKMNDGSYGGLIQIEKLVNKVNALENLVNSILTTLKGTTIPLAPSGTYPFAPLYSAFNNISPITSKADIENDKITHGK